MMRDLLIELLLFMLKVLFAAIHLVIIVIQLNNLATTRDWTHLLRPNNLISNLWVMVLDCVCQQV